MKIVKLTAENVKRLRAVEITPDGDMVVIAGRNGQGKSSVIDSIAFALEGGKKGVLSETPRPIREGEDHASVKLDLGDLVITRTWTRKKDGEVSTTLVVSNADGATYNSPQSMLDKLIGRLSFDPLGFTQMDDRTQLATLLDLVDLPFDPEEVAKVRAAFYQERTIEGRRLKELEGQLAGLPEISEVPESVSVSDLLEERANRQDEHAERTRLEYVAHSAAEQIGMREVEIARMDAQLRDAREDLVLLRKDHVAAETTLAEYGTPKPIEEIDEKLRTAEETNALVTAAARRAEVAVAVDGSKAKVTSISNAISDLDAKKSAAVAAAEMPVEGLGFDEEGVTYQGIPFAQCSSAEQLRVSMAMAMASNPEIRVIRILDGSLLDSANMALIAEMAAEKEFQVWIEVVDESGKLGIVIEDGAVRGEA